MNTFDKAFGITVGLEGGYSNNSFDRGSKTNFGITEAVARANGYNGPMEQLPLDTAKAIYKSQYWNKLRLDDIANLSADIAIELFDTSVNMGTATAGKFLQRALNCFCKDVLSVDGIIGIATIEFYRSVPIGLFPSILKMLNAQQCIRYMEIVEKDPEQVIFLKGWIDKRVN